jgi:hypothetical protein
MDEISKLALLLADIRARSARSPGKSKDAVSVETILSRLARVANGGASLTDATEPASCVSAQLEDSTSKN